MTLSPGNAALLVVLTLVWGFNWPVMKLGVSEFPPLSFRVLSMWLGLPVLWLFVRWQGTALRVPRRHWPELVKLTVTNMLVWHMVAIVAIQALSSGRAAILGYTMPVFSALWGFALFGQRLTARQLAGVAAAGLGASLLLWHEFAQMAGRPLAALGMLLSAAAWALGTQQLRRTMMPVPTMAIAFWMTALTTGVMSVLAVALERPQWHAPSPTVWWAVVYNGVGIFGFAQPAWFHLARALPPIASTLSVMMIPVLGVFSGAVWLGETLHWQDGAAMLLLMAAIGSVLWPARAVPGGASAGVGVGVAEGGEDLPLALLHGLRRRLLLVVVALGVQRAMHQQVCVVRLQRQAELPRLALDHLGAQDQVGQHQRLALVVEGQHVGRVVAAAVVAVQGTALVGVDQAHGDLRRAVERGADPARHPVPRQGPAVPRVGELQRQAQRRAGRPAMGGRAAHAGSPRPWTAAASAS